MNGRDPGVLYKMGAAKWAPHISRQGLNQTLFISIIFYKLKAAEIVTGRMSASREKKKKKKNLKPRRERLMMWWWCLGKEGWKRSKFTVIGRYQNVPFKWNGTCPAVAWVLHSPPVFLFRPPSLFSFPCKLSRLLPASGSRRAPTLLFPFTSVHYALWFSGNIKNGS